MRVQITVDMEVDEGLSKSAIKNYVKFAILKYSGRPLVQPAINKANVKRVIPGVVKVVKK